MVEGRACPECGAEVPTGRLSCGACGALLAAVNRHGSADAPRDGQTAAGWDAAAEPPAAPVIAAPVIAAPVSPFLPLPVPAAVAPPAAAAQSAAVAQPAAVAPPAAAAQSAAVAQSAAAAQPEVIVEPHDMQTPFPSMPLIPGAYLAPSTVVRSAPIAAPLLPTQAPAPAAASAASPTPPAGPGPIEPTTGTAAHVPVLELPFVLAPGIGPRLVAAGAGLAVLAFVLPWVSDGGVVIGGAFGSGYFATWGLAAVGNILPFLIAWVSLIMAVLPNRVPRFAALGVLPVLLGGVLAGLGWTYLIAPFGPGIGIWALAGAALLLAAGGSLVLHAGRLAE